MPVQLATTTPDYQAKPTVPYAVHDNFARLTTFTNNLEGQIGALATRVTSPAAQPPLTAAQLAQIAKELSATGSAPLVVSNLPGAGGSSLLVGTHAQRLITQPSTNASFYESDRHALYSASGNVWVLVGSCPEMEVTGVGALPSDLGGNDAAFYALDTETGAVWLWDGAVWHWHTGILYGPIASRPVAFVGCDAGVIYVASDLGYLAWHLSYASGAWVLIEGWGGPVTGNLSAIPTPTINDVGYLYFAQDFDRLYGWNGTAWQDYPGQPTRGQVCLFGAGVGPGTGWALCNGSNATFSTSSGGTASIATPNLLSTFLYGASSAGTTGSAVSFSYQTGATAFLGVNYTSMIPFIRL